MARDVIARIKDFTDKPVMHIVLTHYHAVRVLGASGYPGAEVIASDVTRDMISAERDLEMWRALEGAEPIKSAEVHT